MKLKIFGAALTVILLLCTKLTWAQSYAQSAVQFGRTTPGGSARIQGIGGAQIALGGDYSSGLSNPAGLGMYNKSEVTFSPGFNAFNTSANYLGNTSTNYINKLNIPGISLVLNIPKNDNGFLGGSLGISMTRINDFNQSFLYHGTPDSVNSPNNSTSIIDSFINLANGQNTSQFDEGNSQYNTPTGLAYYNYLIGPNTLLNPPGSPKAYFSDVKATSYPNQLENVQTNGATNQWSFSYGGNYKDKLFFGAGIGLATLHYKTSKSYSENFASDPALNGLSLNENLDIKGSGLNLTMGVIGRPVNFIQVGASFTTPTIYQLSEKYDASMNTSWKNFDYWTGSKYKNLNNVSAQTDIVTSDYVLKTPYKLSTGIAFISKYGFLTGDVELTNPSSSRYSAIVVGDSYTDDNNEIKANYQKRVLNYRLGAELRYSIFRFRAGYGVQASTYNKTDQYGNLVDNHNSIQTISGGAGIRMKKFFIDFAYVVSNGKDLYSPYINASTVHLQNSLAKGIFTVGFTF